MKRAILILSAIALLVLIYGAFYGVSDWPQAVRDLQEAGRQWVD